MLEEQVMMGWEGIGHHKEGHPQDGHEQGHQVLPPQEGKGGDEALQQAVKDHKQRLHQDGGLYIKKKSLEDSRLEFKWQTGLLDSRVTMKAKYKYTKFPVWGRPR